MRGRVKAALVVVALALVAVLAFVLLSPQDVSEPSAPAADESASAEGAVTGGGGAGGAAGSQRRQAGDAATSGGAKQGESSAVMAVAEWGQGPGQLGRSREQEANPEAPMSFTLDPRGNALVLDQVNGRLVRYSKDGKVLDTVQTTQQAPQDVAAAPNGAVAVLDRLADKSVAILKDGRPVGELPIEGKGVEEGGGVTGVFVDGKDVYVEYEHGSLVKVGDTDGKIDEERPEIPGRPSRDGKAYLSASIVDPATGRLMLNANARPSQDHLFTRELRLGVPVVGILLLDSDNTGTVYLATLIEVPGSADPDAGTPSVAVKLLCLSGKDGSPVGMADLPPNEMAEETFRDFAVMPEGGVLYSYRTEIGVSYQRYHCR